MIRRIDGRSVVDSDDLRWKVAAVAPGTRLELDVIRDGRPLQVEVEVGRQPANIRR